MTWSQTTGETHRGDKRFCDFTGRKAGSGPSSAILHGDGALRVRAALSKAAGWEKVAPEPGSIRRMLERFPFERNRSNDKKSLKLKMLEQALIEKVYQLFRSLL
jgi:hypothetical protein